MPAIGEQTGHPYTVRAPRRRKRRQPDRPAPVQPNPDQRPRFTPAQQTHNARYTANVIRDARRRAIVHHRQRVAHAIVTGRTLPPSINPRAAPAGPLRITDQRAWRASGGTNLRELQDRARKQRAARLAPGLAILNQLTRPIHAVAGETLSDVRRGGLSEILAVHAPGSKAAADRRRALSRGIQNKDKYLFSDVLRAAGVRGPAASIGGFALDVALDPVNLVPGAGGIARAGVGRRRPPDRCREDRRQSRGTDSRDAPRPPRPAGQPEHPARPRPPRALPGGPGRAAPQPRHQPPTARNAPAPSPKASPASSPATRTRRSRTRSSSAPPNCSIPTSGRSRSSCKPSTTASTARSTRRASSARSSRSSATARAARNPSLSARPAANACPARSSRAPRPAPTAGRTASSAAASTTSTPRTRRSPTTSAPATPPSSSAATRSSGRCIASAGSGTRARRLAAGEEVYKFAPRRMPVKAVGEDELKSLLARRRSRPAATSTGSCIANLLARRPSRTSRNASRASTTSARCGTARKGRSRPILTVPNPQYHLTNLYGDLHNAYLGSNVVSLARSLGVSSPRPQAQGEARSRVEDARQAGRPGREGRQDRRGPSQRRRSARRGGTPRRDRAGLHRPRPRRRPRRPRQGSRGTTRPRQSHREARGDGPQDRDRQDHRPPRAPDRHDPRHQPVPGGRRPARHVHRWAPPRPDPRPGGRVRRPPPLRLRRPDDARTVASCAASSRSTRSPPATRRSRSGRS
jgi:hypothetical protein